MEDVRKLLVDIARCSVADEIRSGACKASPCQKIVQLQTDMSFQIPEPWSGQIDIAPILFISSNPSIDELELYPDQSWDLDRTTDFFHNRFTSAADWVDEKLCALRRDGTRTQWVRIWASARGRAGDILGEDKKKIVPGKDFAMTEIVHCKSRNEEGVEDAEDCCSTLYLERMLTISPARVVIVYGARAKRVVNSRFTSRMNPLRQNLSTLSLGRWSRIVAFLPHPNERGSEKTLAANIGDVGLELIRTHLADYKHP